MLTRREWGSTVASAASGLLVACSRSEEAAIEQASGGSTDADLLARTVVFDAHGYAHH